VGGEPHDPRTGVHRNRERHRGGRDSARARGERPAARPSDAEGARHDRDGVDAHGAVDLGARRAALGDAADALHRGRPGIYFRTPKSLVALGLSLRLVARRPGSREHDLASVVYLAAGLAFRFAWVYAGRTSATDDAAVAAMGRGRRVLQDAQTERREARASSSWRSPLPLPDVVRRGYGEAIRLISLGVERRLRRLRRRSP